jgi:hypothetical protein
MTEVHIEELGGNCPVQATGTIREREFYFRARGSHWSFDVFLTPNVTWTYSENYGTGFDAGWMTEDEARGFIEKAANMFLEWNQYVPKPEV